MNPAHAITPDYLEPARNCICFNVRKTARAITQLYDDALRSSGLRATQFTLLVGIQVTGPVTVNRLAEALVTNRTTLTRNLKPLEKMGLVQIVLGKDRREREVTLTSAGESALGIALPLWKQVQQQVSQKMGSKKVGRLLKDLAGAIEVIQAT